MLLGRSKWWVGMALGVVALAAGCAEPGVKFINGGCQPVVKDGRIESLKFRCSIEVRELADEQLIYQVRLFNRDRRPVRSHNGRYETKDGIVGATRTFMVFEPRQTMQNIHVSIPVEELGIRDQDQLPLIAELGFYRVTGECVGRSACRVGISRIEQILPPLEAGGAPAEPETRPAEEPADNRPREGDADAADPGQSRAAPAPVPDRPPDPRPEPDAAWFVRSADPLLPVMLGPFETRDEAVQAVPNAEKGPEKMRSNDFVWFVPLWRRVDGTAVDWFGPCCCVADAEQVAKALNDELAGILAQVPDVRSDDFAVGTPLRLALDDGLGKQSHSSGSGLYAILFEDQAPATAPAP